MHAHTQAYKQNDLPFSCIRNRGNHLVFLIFPPSVYALLVPCISEVFQSHFLFSLSALCLAALSRFNYIPASQLLTIFPSLSFPLQFLFLIPIFSVRDPKTYLSTLGALFPYSLPQPITLYRFLSVTHYYYTQLHIYLRL